MPPLNAFDSSENSHSPGLTLHPDEKAELMPNEGERELCSLSVLYEVNGSAIEPFPSFLTETRQWSPQRAFTRFPGHRKDNPLGTMLPGFPWRGVCGRLRTGGAEGVQTGGLTLGPSSQPLGPPPLPWDFVSTPERGQSCPCGLTQKLSFCTDRICAALLSQPTAPLSRKSISMQRDKLISQSLSPMAHPLENYAELSPKPISTV